MLAVAVVVAAGAQAPQTPPSQTSPAQTQATTESTGQQRPTFRTEANLVRVDVFPTAGGEPVLDLGRDEFQVFEDGVPQTLDSFEHVIVRPAGPQAARVEPNSSREALQMAADPHARVFIVFLDTYHVGVGGSRGIRWPLINLIDRVLEPDDLVGFMTPDMSAAQIVLARKTEVVERGLEENWIWGRRGRLTGLDPIEEVYDTCYPPDPQTEQHRRRSWIADQMIRRRRERLTLDALFDLVRYLDGIRDEHKSIITITDGWLLFGRDARLSRVPPVIPGVWRDPGGTRSTNDERGNVDQSGCDWDRLRMADYDHQRYFRDLLTEAERSNASFYPVDPRGLPASDTSIGEDPVDPGNSVTSPSRDQAMLKARSEALRTAAVATGGMAVLGSNDIDSGLERVVADLNSYYLLSYYSTNAALDGKWRNIDVKVTRPGVDVRARRGYRAASAEEIAAGMAAAERPPVDEERAAVDEAIARLSSIRHDTRLQVAAVPVVGGGQTRLALVGELDPALARSEPWRQGSEAAVIVTGTAGASLALARVKIVPGARTFEADLPLSGVESLTECTVQVRLSAGRAAPIGEVARVALPGPEAPAVGAPLLFRRSPTTGNAWWPAADMRFGRTERVRLEAPLSATAGTAAGRLLDRTGQPLDVPVAVSERTDGEQRWLVAEITLAPLTSGDYVVELSATDAGKTEKAMVAVRVVR